MDRQLLTRKESFEFLILPLADIGCHICVWDAAARWNPPSGLLLILLMQSSFGEQFRCACALIQWGSANLAVCFRSLLLSMNLSLTVEHRKSTETHVNFWFFSFVYRIVFFPPSSSRRNRSCNSILEWNDSSCEAIILGRCPKAGVSTEFLSRAWF